MHGARERERIQTVVIGGGQAGLAAGYHLARRGLPFVILEANQRVGDSWRERWDSLRLFTPARFDGLPGMRFPAAAWTFPTKDEMADYLETYAAKFELPVRTGVRVDRLERRGDGFRITAGNDVIDADNVVVAMANFQKRRVPSFARELDPDIVQLHSCEYRSPDQLRDGEVLIVGAGNSGSEIAMEVSRTHRTRLAGRDTGHVPFRIDGFAARFIVPVLFRIVFHRVLSVATPIGRKVRRKLLAIGGPLIRVKPQDLAAAGVERLGRMTAVRDGRPVIDRGNVSAGDTVAAGDDVLDVTNVIWCTGFDPGFSWIDIPIHGEVEPMHDRGVVPGVPGLYFVGLHFLSAMSSVMIHGVERDAARIADHIRARARAASAANVPRPTAVAMSAAR
jgi:putative flavoprotein involved in K+ transport